MSSIYPRYHVPASTVPNSAELASLNTTAASCTKGDEPSTCCRHVDVNLTAVGDRLNRNDIVIRIVNGGQNMPAFANNLTPEQLNELVAFLQFAEKTLELLGALDSNPWNSEEVTDMYLADLAAKHGARFGTFDQTIAHAAVGSGVVVIGSAMFFWFDFL